MANMSYCMFENTSNDIRDCIDVLEENDWDLEGMIKNSSSGHEARSMRRFVNLCKDVASRFEDCDLD